MVFLVAGLAAHNRGVTDHARPAALDSWQHRETELAAAQAFVPLKKGPRAGELPTVEVRGWAAKAERARSARARGGVVAAGPAPSRRPVAVRCGP